MKVDLLTPHTVHAVATSGGPTAQQYFVRQAKFMYSTDSPFELSAILTEEGNAEQVSLVDVAWVKTTPTNTGLY